MAIKEFARRAIEGDSSQDYNGIRAFGHRLMAGMVVKVGFGKTWVDGIDSDRR